MLVVFPIQRQQVSKSKGTLFSARHPSKGISTYLERSAHRISLKFSITTSLKGLACLLQRREYFEW